MRMIPSLVTPHSTFEKEAGLGSALSRGVGRVVTNLVEPRSYGVGTKLDTIRRAGLAGSVKAVIKDQPIYRGSDTFNDTVTAVRELPYRRMFGLPARPFGLGVYTKNGPGSFHFNLQPGDKKLRWPDPLTPLRRVHDVGTQYDRGRKFTGRDHHVMGTYSGFHLPGGGVAYKDVWDLALNHGEKAYRGGSEALRWIISKLTKPITIEGTVKQVADGTLRSLPSVKGLFGS